MLVGQIIEFTGTSDLKNTCDTDSDIGLIERTIVRLVA